MTTIGCIWSSNLQSIYAFATITVVFNFSGKNRTGFSRHRAILGKRLANIILIIFSRSRVTLIGGSRATKVFTVLCSTYTNANVEISVILQEYTFGDSRSAPDIDIKSHAWEYTVNKDRHITIFVRVT